ncbi:uncharacterized protein BDZ99DRAFT_545518, partial [Mytilinidion resinicola]
VPVPLSLHSSSHFYPSQEPLLNTITSFSFHVQQLIMMHYLSLLFCASVFASLVLANGYFEDGGEPAFAVEEANASVASVCKYLRTYRGDTWFYNATLENRTACRTYSSFDEPTQKTLDNLDKTWYYEIHLISNPKNGQK